MGYWKLFRTEPRPLIFGVLNGFFSGLGQTHFISLFGPIIIAKYHLSNTEYGSLYSLATLTSALALPFIGPLIDRKDIRYFCLFLGLGLIASELLFVKANHIILLFIALSGLRLLGQGLGAQVSGTTTARYFSLNRGKALSITNLGFPLAEGLLTPLVAFVMTIIHWQTVSLILAGAVLLIYIPLVLFLTKDNQRFNHPSLPTSTPKEEQKSLESASRQKHWTRKEVFSNKQIYWLIPHAIIPPFTLTGLIFHQAVIGELKGWSLSTIATGLAFFALTRILMSFIIGPQVDHYSARKLFPFHLVPLALGFMALSLLNNSTTPALCYALFGLAVGSGGSIKSALWAELYGTKYLGSIKSALATIMVLSTAASPFLFGLVLDAQGEIHSLLWGMTLLTLITSLLCWLELRVSPSASRPAQ